MESVSSQQADCLVSSSPDCHQLRWPTDLLCASLRSRSKWKPFNRLNHGLMGVKCLQWHPAHARSSISSGCQHTVLPVQPSPCLSVHAKPGPSQSILFPRGAVFCFCFLGDALFLVLVFAGMEPKLRERLTPMSRGLPMEEPSTVSSQSQCSSA